MPLTHIFARAYFNIFDESLFFLCEMNLCIFQNAFFLKCVSKREKEYLQVWVIQMTQRIDAVLGVFGYSKWVFLKASLHKERWRSVLIESFCQVTSKMVGYSFKYLCVTFWNFSKILAYYSICNHNAGTQQSIINEMIHYSVRKLI